MYGLPSPKERLHISLGAAETQRLHLVFISCHINFSITHIFTQVFAGLIMAYFIAYGFRVLYSLQGCGCHIILSKTSFSLSLWVCVSFSLFISLSLFLFISVSLSPAHTRAHTYTLFKDPRIFVLDHLF